MSQEAATPAPNATAQTAVATSQAVTAKQGPSGSPASGGDSGDTMSSQVSSMADLKTQAPKVYNAMMEGIAMNICNEMKKHQDHLKQMMDESRRRT